MTSPGDELGQRNNTASPAIKRNLLIYWSTWLEEAHHQRHAWEQRAEVNTSPRRINETLSRFEIAYLAKRITNFIQVPPC